MIKPTVGLMAFHDGHPVECLRLVWTSDQGELWLVRPLMIPNPANRTELFRSSDRLTPLHSKSA